MALTMLSARTVPQDHPAFAALPARFVTIGNGRGRVAVHIGGRIADVSLPVVCVPGFHRNMSDYTEFLAILHRQLGAEWPVVLVDLPGRGRSADRPRASDYGSPRDGRDLGDVLDALGIGAAVLVGQGYGGQVIMAMAAQRPGLVAGTVLIDSGPVSDARGLVRLRNNLADIGSVRGESAFHRMMRQMLAVDHPGAADSLLDRLALRSHFLDGRGRVRALFDTRMLKLLEGFEHDDILVAQWPLFTALGNSPLLLMRTQLTEQVRREVFDEMMRRRRDAQGFLVEGQGSPALLDHADDVRPISDFIGKVRQWRGRFSGAAA